MWSLGAVNVPFSVPDGKKVNKYAEDWKMSATSQPECCQETLLNKIRV